METGNKLTNTEAILYVNNQFHFWDKLENKEVSFSKNNLPELPVNPIVYIDTPHFNLIPFAIAENISEYEKASFLSSNSENKSLVNHKIQILNSELSWLIDNDENNFIKNKIPGVTIKHISEAIINLNTHSKNSIRLLNTSSAIFVSIHIDNQFKLINRFPITNNEDLLYYTLLSIKETELSKTTFTLNYHGAKNDDFIKKLKTTLPNCTIEKAEPNSYLSIVN